MSARDGRRLGFPLGRERGRRRRGQQGRGKSLLWDGGISEGRNTLCCIGGFRPLSGEGIGETNRPRFHSLVGILRKREEEGGAAESDRTACSILSFRGRDATRKSIFLKGGVGKKGESEKEEDERSSQSVCRARLNLRTGKFRLRLEVMQKSGTDGDHSTFEVFLLPDPVGTHAGREEEGAGKKERED